VVKATLYISILILASSCLQREKLPVEKYYEFDYPATYSYNADTLKIRIGNPLKCPLRISISSHDTSLNEVASKFGTLTLQEKKDTVITYYLRAKKGVSLEFNTVFGDLSKPIVKERMSLPFPENKSYRIIQGYNGVHSHYTPNSYYAIDFGLNIKDTICSAGDGYVVGVIKDYNKSGRTEDWFDYSNYITIYHPKSGLFTQYVHLIQNGSLVRVGDSVKKGQPIGLCGMTGYTTIPHLHFNVKKPDAKEGLVSTDIEFEEGYKGTELDEDAIVKK
jgi:murein DD-endopeptidase MepM/ murein hydrolase activator NlpD